MMGREELIEVVGLALAHWFKDGDTVFAIGDLEGTVLGYIDDGPFDMAELAQAALSAIEGAGFVVVPREPTEAMREAALGRPDDPNSDMYSAIYRAMISAYSPKPSGVEDE